MTGLSKIVGNELAVPLRNLTVLPLLLSPERDDALCQLTEGRMPIFSHDLVPDYLRTKPEPTAEQKMIAHETKAANLSMEAAAKQVAQYTKQISHIHDMVSKAREEWESDSIKPGLQQTTSIADTHALLAAIAMGKSLKMEMGVGPMGPGGMMHAPNVRPVAPMSAVSPGQAGGGGGGPFKSHVKTNIKSGTQIHPFGR